MSDHPTPSHYQRRVGGVLLDPYRIARVYGLDDHALFSALKKILAAGKRGAKDTARDVQDAIDALLRWQEMERGDATPDPMTAALDAVDSHDPRECAARIAELECAARLMEDALPDGAGVANDYRRTHDRVADVVADLSIARNRISELECELTAEREAHEATRRELEHRVGVAKDCIASTNQLLAEIRGAAGVNSSNALPSAVERMSAKLAEYEERYRPRRQSKEPAPENEGVLQWVPHAHGLAGAWIWMTGKNVSSRGTWTHQPPAPEGE